MQLLRISYDFLSMFSYAVTLVASSLSFGYFVYWLLSRPKLHVINDKRTMRKYRKQFKVVEDNLWTKIITKIYWSII